MEIIVKTTNDCNLSCAYCSGGNPKTVSKLNIDIVKKMIDDIPSLLTKIKEDSISILWHGGEPLLQPISFYREAMDYATVTLKNYKVTFKIQTNGSLIDEHWIELFQDYNVSVGVSLDGYQELHDVNRRDKLGQPTFLKIMKNIQLLKDKDIGVGILMVLNTREPVDVDRLFDFICQNEFSCKIHPVFPSGRAELRQDIDELYQLYISLMKELYCKMIESEVDVNIDPLSDMLNAIVNDESMGECSFAGSCGQSFLCIFEDGGVSFCGRDSNDFGLNYGSIASQTLTELYYSVNAEKIRCRSEKLLEKDCACCDDYILCHGGCAFEAALVYGHINGKYPHCQQWRELISFMRHEGLALLHQRLLKQKEKQKEQIELKELLLEVLAGSGV